MITDKTECNNPLFGRILTAMVTPFTENGDVDYELAIKLSNYLFENGSDGIVLCGTTGESPTLSWAEQHDLFIAVKGSLDATCKVLVGTGSNCTSEAVEATKKAYESGADGALVVVPYYNKPPQEGLIIISVLLLNLQRICLLCSTTFLAGLDAIYYLIL